MTNKSDIAVSVRGLSKSYAIAHNAVQHSTLGEALVHRLKNPLHRPERETFWALQDVDFDIHKGDVVGIIGRNGAGKSTLLKILSRITEPTRGKAILNGRVGSLLEVGTGFHAELTGRENIYLNGAILGMTKREIARQFDAIVDFSGTEQFLDTPVKRYSSGMYVRLAFAVAAHLNPEILIVDEVLAVGDAEFQKKCLGKMKDVAQSGRTVLFVSHQMQSVALLCKAAIFLRRGQIDYIGGVNSAIDHYLASFLSDTTPNEMSKHRPGSGEYRFSNVSTDRELLGTSEDKTIYFQIEKRKGNIGQMYLAAHIVDKQGVIVAQCDSRLNGQWLTDSGDVEGHLSLKSLWLKPGTYRIDVAICAAGIVDLYEGACILGISPILPYPNTASSEGFDKGFILCDFSWCMDTAPQDVQMAQ